MQLNRARHGKTSQFHDNFASGKALSATTPFLVVLLVLFAFFVTTVFLVVTVAFLVVTIVVVMVVVVLVVAEITAAATDVTATVPSFVFNAVFEV
jgi:hypothetical protein